MCVSLAAAFPAPSWYLSCMLYCAPSTRSTAGDTDAIDAPILDGANASALEPVREVFSKDKKLHAQHSRLLPKLSSTHQSIRTAC